MKEKKIQLSYFQVKKQKRTGDKNSTVTFPEEDLKQEGKRRGINCFS